jgi:hypothetical protein
VIDQNWRRGLLPLFIRALQNILAKRHSRDFQIHLLLVGKNYILRDLLKDHSESTDYCNDGE